MKEKGELFNDFFTVATFCFSYIRAETTASWLTPFVYTPSLKEGKKWQVPILHMLLTRVQV